MVGAVTPSLVNLLVIMINESLQSGSTKLFGTNSSVGLTVLYALFIIILDGIFWMSTYLVMAGGTNVIAQMFRKQGNFSGLVYLTSAFTTPLLLLYAISTYIGRFGWPPLAILVYELIAWGAAIIAVYNVKTGKAILLTIVAGIITIVSFFFFLMILGLLISGLGLVP